MIIIVEPKDSKLLRDQLRFCGYHLKAADYKTVPGKEVWTNR